MALAEPIWNRFELLIETTDHGGDAGRRGIVRYDSEFRVAQPANCIRRPEVVSGQFGGSLPLEIQVCPGSGLARSDDHATHRDGRSRRIRFQKTHHPHQTGEVVQTRSGIR